MLMMITDILDSSRVPNKFWNGIIQNNFYIQGVALEQPWLEHRLHSTVSES